MKLDLYAEEIDISAYKIDGFYLDSFEIDIADCLIKIKLRKVQNFEKIFLLAQISLKIVVKMLFLIFNKT